jgi:nucleoid DNA-binding protein
LQQHLADLGNLLRNAKAITFANELDAIVNALAPFRELPFKEFGSFLIRAEEFARTGQVSAAGGGSKRAATRAAKPPKPPKATAAEVTERARHILEKAASASVSDEELAGLVASLNGLNKAEVAEVANTIEVGVKKSANKGVIIAEIKNRIENRQGSRLRAEMIHPPLEPSPQGAEAASSEPLPV